MIFKFVHCRTVKRIALQIISTQLYVMSALFNPIFTLIRYVLFLYSHNTRYAITPLLSPIQLFTTLTKEFQKKRENSMKT